MNNGYGDHKGIRLTIAFLIAMAMILSVATFVVGPPGDIVNCVANPDTINYGETTTIYAQIEPDFAMLETPDQAEYFVETIHTIPPPLAQYGTGFQMNLTFDMGWYWGDDTFYSNLLPGPGIYTIWAHAHVMPTDEWRAPGTDILTVNAAPPDVQGPNVTVGPDCNPNPTAGATTVDLTATISDADTGGRLISAAEYFVEGIDGFPPWTNGTGNSMSASPGYNMLPTVDVSDTINVGAWIPGIYNISVHGMDDLNNWGPFGYVDLDVTGAGPTMMIPLAQGWNLVSVPYEQLDTSITTVLSSIDGDYKFVLYYDASDPMDSWKTYNPSRPSKFNDLTDINHTMGFWININKTGGTLLDVNGDPPSSPTSIHLYPGWNMVGYPCINNDTRDGALNNLVYGVNITYMKYYNVSQGTLLEMENSGDPVHVGWGFWMFAPSETDWMVDPN